MAVRAFWIGFSQCQKGPFRLDMCQGLQQIGVKMCSWMEPIMAIRTVKCRASPHHLHARRVC